MATAVILPQLGQTMEEATIVRWLKNEGDVVKKGDVLLEIQTDKAVLEVESFASGTLLKILAEGGETLPVLEVIGFIGEPGEELPEVRKQPPRKAAPPSEKKAGSRGPLPTGGALPASAEIAEAAVSRAARPAAVETRLRISPRARRLAKERVIDPTKIVGTGPEGRVIERDVLTYLERKGYERLLISPTARRLAGELEVDILDVKGTGPAGKIVEGDVLKAEREKPRPLSMTRKIIATKMVKSAREIPSFLATVSVDVTELSGVREKLNRERPQRISYNDFIVEACGLALRSFPVVNGACLGETYVIKEDINIGIAVDAEEGLIVPVIKNADHKSLDRIAAESAQMVEKVKKKKLLPDELEGGTFTISNMGMLGVETFTAIIPPGQAAILAVGRISDAVVVHKGKPAVRKVMKMTLTSDHRIIDGATAARFLNEVKEKLENPTWAR